MVELTLKDYNTLLRWWELIYAKLPLEKITLEDRRLFWKISFLIEDELEAHKMFSRKEEDDD